MEERNIDYDDKENKSGLVTKLQKDIGEETQREIKGTHHNAYIYYFFFLFHLLIANLQINSCKNSIARIR